MARSKILLEVTSPNGNITAIVEQDDRVTYFYLHGPQESFGMKPCWVRNHRPAPAEQDVAAMGAGQPPMLEKANCAHPQGAPPLDEKKLRVVWFEEGDAGALFEGDDLLAVIPGWGGVKGFPGYARDCTGQSLIAWPLPKTDVLPNRLRRAQAYWQEWDNDYWGRVQPTLVADAERALGPHDRYFAIDGGNWPPKALVLFRRPHATILVTLGVSMRPQPLVEQYENAPNAASHIELALAVDPSIPEASVLDLGSYLSNLTSFPWRFVTWLGSGHTVNCDVMPPFTAMLLDAAPPGAPPLHFTDFRGDKVQTLWLRPIAEPERIWCEQNTSEQLIDMLNARGATYIARPRDPIV